MGHCLCVSVLKLPSCGSRGAVDGRRFVVVCADKQRFGKNIGQADRDMGQCVTRTVCGKSHDVGKLFA